MSFGAGGESRAFLMPHVNPFNRTIPAQRVRESIERIPHDTEHALHARVDQCTNHIVGSYRRHFTSP
jgi:hypothetical protein